MRGNIYDLFSEKNRDKETFKLVLNRKVYNLVVQALIGTYIHNKTCNIKEKENKDLYQVILRLYNDDVEKLNEDIIFAEKIADSIENNTVAELNEICKEIDKDN